MAAIRLPLTIDHIKAQLSLIYDEHIAVRVCMRLGAEPTFSFKQQVRRLWQELKACQDIVVPYQMLESLFGIKKSRISEIVVSNEATERNIPNKRRFSDNDEIVMILEITDRFQSGKPFTYQSFINYINEEFHAVVGRKFVDSFLDRHNDEVTSHWCIPREGGRMEVSRDETTRYRAVLDQYVVGKLTCANIVIDECGCQNWPEARPQLILVPSDATQGQLRYKVKRNGHLYTVMPAISLCGDTLPPLLVTKRLALDIDIHATGLRENEDVIIVHGPKCYINTLIFRAWVIDVLLPYVDSLRPDKLGVDQEAILIMDNLPAHKNVDTLEILRRSNVRPVFIPAHSSYALKVENLLTFAVLKGELKKANNESDALTQAQRIARIVAATEAATMPSRNRSAFRRASLVIVNDNGHLYAAIDELEWNARMNELFPAVAQ
ncbi:MAG: hypothetical protein EZS28_010572 [Streblomastix strix]|uniref:DDE-1 domain-containing protein n=1 Tax=Streblomastix strix TaxID=222440 RepID=A0A5J4WH64_9EUKA|nr:MAG: hypothetical protein EZS28_010572 [Streblomastix strix]